MGTIRLGKRTEGRSPKINEFVPLAGLDDLVFGGWDIFEEDCYAAARTAGVLEHVAARAGAARARGDPSRWPAVFDQRYVKRLDGPNVKKGKNKRDLAEQVIADIRDVQGRQHGCDRLVMVWCGSTEVFMKESRGARSRSAAFEKGARAERRSGDSVEHGVRVRRDSRGHSVRQRRAEPDRRHSGAAGARRADRSRRSPATT